MIRVRLGSVVCLRAWPHLKPALVSRALDSRRFRQVILPETVVAGQISPGHVDIQKTARGVVIVKIMVASCVLMERLASAVSRQQVRDGAEMVI